MVDSRLRKRVNRIASVLAVAALLTSGCAHKSGLPDTGSPAYAEFCTAFYTGLAGLQSGEDVRAKDDLTRASQLAPGEPTAWANLSVFQLRRQEYDAALTSAEKALGLAPDNSRIEALLGQIQSKRGDVSECVGHFKRAISLDNKNLKAIYALALESERQGSDAEAERALDRLLAARPANTVVLLEVARLSAKLKSS
jgi:Flp pilus assembly protein TadD